MTMKDRGRRPGSEIDGFRLKGFVRGAEGQGIFVQVWAIRLTK